MRMTKQRAEELLEKVEEELKEARKQAQESKDQVELLTCAKAYLEFIISGLKRNPSLKKGKEDE